VTTGDGSVERVRELVERVVGALGLDGRVEAREEDGEVHVVVDGADLGLFIGRHGSTIDAVQHLAYKAASHAVGSPVRVVVDAEGYRERRRAALERQADQAAAEALRASRPVALEAMSATERKVVHEYLKDRPGVETWSEGAEPHRHLVVGPLAG
jgi:spoIIIJ-associated protein